MNEITLISLKDIYSKMDLYLNTTNYKYLNNNEKRNIVETGLKKYVISKIREANDSLIVDESIELYRLVEILSFLLNVNNNEEISNLTNYLLIVMSNEQQFCIKWEEEENDKYTNQPIIDINNNLITKITSSKQDNPITLFNYLNNYYLTSFNKPYTR